MTTQNTIWRCVVVGRKSNMKKKITALLDFNDDGELTVEDIQALAPRIIRHEGMLVAGLVIVIGSLSNVTGYSDIDSDWFWCFAGVAAILEYIDDIRKRRR
jgi:hypothetical protein